MKIKINYLEKEYGCGENAATYMITLGKLDKNLHIKIDFEPPVTAIKGANKNDARIKNAMITLPKYSVI